MAYLSEKGLLPCPFCGGPARTFQYNGTAQASCAAPHTECAGTDVIAPVAMWNRRALSAVALPDELEVAMPGVYPTKDIPPGVWVCKESSVRDTISQAHSTIAALRAKLDEALDTLGRVIMSLPPGTRADGALAGVKVLRQRAETAEAEVKLTEKQVEALAALDAFRDSHWIPTANLNADGVTTVTLRSLFEIDLVDAETTRQGKFWQITPAGRKALGSKK